MTRDKGRKITIENGSGGKSLINNTATCCGNIMGSFMDIWDSILKGDVLHEKIEEKSK